MSIILVRHGETAFNASRVLQPPDTPLSERGRLQAQAVARRLAGMSVGGIISSDLRRAVATAQAIAAPLGLDIRVHASLQERNFGELRGRAYDNLGFDPLLMEDAPAGGESMAAFCGRVAEAMALLREWRAATHGNLVVVSHGLVIRTLIERHLLLPADVSAQQRLANTSLTVFGAETPHRATLINCTTHLVGTLRDDARGLSGV